ncbi:MAG: hypothetical protein GXO07_06815 [Crenarchaeota archaeon]|nr:hypothetical protein [Thermoproteota archaeon]
MNCNTIPKYKLLKALGLIMESQGFAFALSPDTAKAFEHICIEAKLTKRISKARQQLLEILLEAPEELQQETKEKIKEISENLKKIVTSLRKNADLVYVVYGKERDLIFIVEFKQGRLRDHWQLLSSSLKALALVKRFRNGKKKVIVIGCEGPCCKVRNERLAHYVSKVTDLSRTLPKYKVKELLKLEKSLSNADDALSELVAPSDKFALTD